MAEKCCGFCKNYIYLDEGVTIYRGHVAEIGYCPKAGDDLEKMDFLASGAKWNPNFGNWDEAYRWASHTECKYFDRDDDYYNNPYFSYLKEL